MNAEPGLRERKKRRTRQTLIDASIRLFRERGFEATTVADIAAAADVSTRTFFQHFPTKEEVLFADSDERLARLWAQASDRQPGEGFVAAFRRTVLEMLEATLGDPSGVELDRVELLMTTSALQATLLQRIARVQRAAADWLARELGTSPDQIEVSVATAALTHGLWAAVQPRLAAVSAGGDAGRPADALEGLRGDLDRALDLLEAGLSSLEERVSCPPPAAGNGG